MLGGISAWSNWAAFLKFAPIMQTIGLSLPGYALVFGILSTLRIYAR